MLQANLDYVVRPCLKERKREEGRERREKKLKERKCAQIKEKRSTGADALSCKTFILFSHTIYFFLKKKSAVSSIFSCF